MLFVSSAQARRGGIATPGCDGCHSGGRDANVSITLDPQVFAPGATVTATVSVQAVNGNTAGFYMTSDGGRFSAGSGQNIRLISNTEVSHGAPKTGTGNVLFQVQWTAPAQPGGLNLEAFALSANGNGSTSGDGPGSASLGVAFGCEGAQYYVDFDGDGFGQADYPTIIDCAPRMNYAKSAGDCNDNDRDIHPGAGERCNRLDDDCNGQIDEGLSMGAVMLYPDVDGDGYGTVRGTPMPGMGCAAPVGYSPVVGDCADGNAMVHPGAEDVCNLIDDDCNGRSDERSRPRCGVGMCERLSSTCNPNDCIQGQPQAELCNAFDDDCDGVLDNDVSCGAGKLCRAGACVPDDGGGGGSSGGLPEAGAGPGAGAGGTAMPGAGASNGGVSNGGSDAPPAPKDSAGGCAFGSSDADRSPGRAGWFLAIALGAALRRRARSSGFLAALAVGCSGSRVGGSNAYAGRQYGARFERAACRRGITLGCYSNRRGLRSHLRDPARHRGPMLRAGRTVWRAGGGPPRARLAAARIPRRRDAS